MDFWKGIAVHVGSIVLFAVAYLTIGAHTGTQGDPFWLKLAGLLFGLFAVFFLYFPHYRQFRQARVSSSVEASISAGRYAAALAIAKEATDLWPSWSDGWALRGTSELLLWQLEASHASLSRAIRESAAEPAPRTSYLALVAIELLGLPSNELREASGLPPEKLAIPDAVRSARAGEWRAVRTLLMTDGVQRLGGPLRLLAEALLAWAMEATEDSSPRAINKVLLLGESGLDPVRRAWPEFAAFVERARPL